MLSKIKSILFIFAGLVGVITSAGASTQENGILRISGSTTLLPVIAKAASNFMEKYEKWSNLGPAYPNKRVLIYVSGGGSGFGVKSVINGSVNIGLASRAIKEKEKKILGDHQIFLVGKDAVVIAARKDNPLATVRTNFTKTQLANIFSGDIKNYSSLDASHSDSPIVLYIRDSGAGSAEMFQKLILNKRSPSRNALQVKSQGMLLNRLESNANALGYISSGLALGSNKLKVFSLDGIFPTDENVINDKYEFTRPLLMIVKNRPSGIVKIFIDYVMSPSVQKLMSANNYVPAVAVR